MESLREVKCITCVGTVPLFESNILRGDCNVWAEESLQSTKMNGRSGDDDFRIDGERTGLVKDFNH